MRVWGLVLGGLLVAACGHEQTTGSASNNWATPTGYGAVAKEDMRYVNPDAASHRARNRSAFQAQAPTLQPAPAPTAVEPLPPPGYVAPPPPSETTPLDVVPSPDVPPPPEVP